MFTYDVGELTAEEYMELTALVQAADPTAVVHVKVVVSFTEYQVVEPLIEEFLQREEGNEIS